MLYVNYTLIKKNMSPTCAQKGYHLSPFPPRKRNLVPALSVESKQPTLKKLGHGNPFGRTEAWLSYRNESLTWNFSLLFLEAIFAKLHCHNHGQEATPTHTKNRWPWSTHLHRNYNLGKIRIWKSYTYINLNMEHYIRDRIKLLTFYDIIIVNNKNYHCIGQFSTLLYLRH